MIQVRYERYWNDFARKNERASFQSLDALADWIFGQMQQDYTKDNLVMSFPTPEKLERINEDGPYNIEFKPTRGGENIWIYLIENSEGIIFSSGKFTAGQKYWSSAVKERCIACDQRQHSPKFNFVKQEVPSIDYGIYPLTVLSDRYNGCYSGGRWTAWNKYPDDIPYGPFGDDTSCMEFWRDERSFPVGVGATPGAAIRDLKGKMRKER